MIRIQESSYYYIAFAALTGIHFLLTFSARWLLLNKAKRQLLSGKIYFNTLMIGSQDNAMGIFKETEKSLHDGGYRYAGFVTPDNNARLNDSVGQGKNGIQKLIPKLGSVNELEKIIDENNIQLVVIAMEKSEQLLLGNIINRLSEKDVEIKIQPNILDILSGSVKTSNVNGCSPDRSANRADARVATKYKAAHRCSSCCCRPGITFSPDVIFSIAGEVFFQRTRVLFTGKNWL
jgi:FlaA1/EpsC-like NDP-sugar epimerase